MSDQSARIGSVLSSLDRADVTGWLMRMRASLVNEKTLDRETVDQLLSRCRPQWGVRSPKDAHEFVAFWSELVEQYDDPRLLGGYADVLFLLGGSTRTCEAVRIYLEAAHRDPTVFIEYSGNFFDAVSPCGPELEREFELAKIGYYAFLVDKGELEVEELQDSVRELLGRFRDQPELRSRLLVIARRSFDG